MFDNIRADWHRFKKYWAGPVLSLRGAHSLLFAYGLHALVGYRMRVWLRDARRRPLTWPAAILVAPTAWAITAYTRRAYGIHLDTSATIGPGLYIGHLGGIHVTHCRIGAHCSINQRVRVEPTPGDSQGPLIEGRVWIGAHAKVVGPICLGAGATVAAGALVTRDVAPRCLVVGRPARVARANFDNTPFM